MQAPILTNNIIRVQSIRSQNTQGFGGSIFYGAIIDNKGNIHDAKETAIVKAPYSLLDGIVIEKGQWWEVYGESETYIDEVNGYHITRKQILPHQMQMVRPSGEHIVQLMADNKAFKGVGTHKARQLWEHFGDKLYEYLDNADITRLAEIVSTETANHITNAWKQYGDTKTLQWFIKSGIKVEMGKKLLSFYGSETSQKIEADPYRLLAFCGSWKIVDAIAMKTFGLKEDDPRRLQGAIEEALYRRFALGDTAVPLRTIQDSLIRLLQADKNNWSEVTSKAMITGFGEGSYIIRENDDDLILHALGPYFMEKTIAREIINRIQIKNSCINKHQMSQELKKFEQKAGFSLNKEQYQAVTRTASHSLSIITGGAGTGKTTVLEALYLIFDKACLEIHQMALSGRAAKRMMETTTRKATTIAGFLRNIDTSHFNDNTVIVIDEASMIDITIMYHILEHITPETKIVLVGDTGQLPPIGAGLVLHHLLNVPEIPVTALKQANRYGNEIAKAALSIRDGEWPNISNDINENISFVQCPPSNLKEQLVSLYKKFINQDIDAQILEPLKAGQYFGTERTNQICQEKFAQKTKPIKLWNSEFDQYERLPICEGEPVICTKNHWDKALQNGSLGRVIEVYPVPREQFNNDNEPVGEAYADIEWDDGIIRPLTEDMVNDIALAYSITVHKAQGSQWDTIIFPVYKSKLLDRSMLYTAITRAKNKIIMIGDLDIAKQVVKKSPKAFNRNTGLLDFLKEHQMNSPTS